MRAASTVFTTTLIMATAGCLHSPGQDPMTGETEETEEGRIDFSRTTSFDGDKLTVFVRDGEDGKLHLNTVRDAVETNEFRPQIPNRSGRSWVLRNTAHESTTQVYALVSWSNEDPADYLAAGWWLRQGEDDQYPERVIFVDGPEIDPLINPPDLPMTGTARYLGWIVEATDVTDLHHEGNRRDEPDSAQRLKALHHRRERPVQEGVLNRLIQARYPLAALALRDDHLVQHDLVGGPVEAEVVEPLEELSAPRLLARVDLAVTQQERANFLALAGAVLDRRLAGTNQIAHRFMGFVRRPDLGELARPVQPCQLHSVAPVCLHPLTGPAWNQGRGDDGAFVAKTLDQSLQPVARRPRLVAEAEIHTWPFQLANETTYETAVRVDLAEKPHLPIASAIGHRDGMAILRHVHSDEKVATLDHGSPSWLEALLVEQPSLKAASVGRTAPALASRRRTYGLTK